MGTLIRILSFANSSSSFTPVRAVCLLYDGHELTADSASLCGAWGFCADWDLELTSSSTKGL